MMSESDVRRGRILIWLCGAFVCLVSGFSTIAAAQAEENIDRAPVVISEANSTRALTAASPRGGFNTTARAFAPGAKTRITVYVTNLDLMSGEDRTAFRADAEDGQHFRYPLEIVSFAPTAERSWVYALTFKLHGAMGDVGDVLLRVNWRGMASNRVRVAIGHTGDGLKDDEGAVPTPMPEKNPIEPLPNLVGLPYAGDRVRFMEQAAFGPTPTLEAQIRRLGYSTWLSQQMEQKYSANNVPRYSTLPYPNLPLMQDNINTTTCNAACQRDNYSMYPVQNWFYQEALYSDDQQLRRRVSWALHQIFVVSGRETVQGSRMVPYIQVLDKNAFGNFKDLLKEMTLNAAMGNYLDMAISTQQNPNENYAREILQLFSVGVNRLNQDGTPMLDGQGNAVPTYDQNTINNFTKVFTGWRLCSLQANCPNLLQGTRDFKDPLELVAANHDTSQKQLLFYQNASPIIPAGQAADEDLRMAIDNIFNHPNVPPFISKLLIQQLVTSNPSPAYVRRVADVFADTAGGGTDRGNLGKVVRAILLDPEARGNDKTDPDYGHLKEPVIYTTNLLRAFGATSNTTAQSFCNGRSDGVVNSVSSNLDQDVFNPPTVFNYYPMDYVIPNTNLGAPEFALMTTGSALKRANFINQFVFGTGGVTGIQGSLTVGADVPCGTRINLTRYQPLAANDSTGVQLVDTLNRELMHGTMSPAMRTEILNAVQAVANTDAGLKRTRTAIYLITTSSQYQVLR